MKTDNREVRKTLDAIERLIEERTGLSERSMDADDLSADAFTQYREAGAVLEAKRVTAGQAHDKAQHALEKFLQQSSQRNFDRLKQAMATVEMTNTAVLHAEGTFIESYARFVSASADYLESLEPIHENSKAQAEASRLNNIAGTKEYERQLAQYEAEKAEAEGLPVEMVN